MRILPSAVAVLLLTACSQGPDVDVSGWTPSDPRVAAVECAQLLDEWGPGERDSPQRCWAYEETDRLGETFATMSASLSTELGAQPDLGPECSHALAPGRLASCRAQWKVEDGYVLLTGGVTLSGLEEVVANGIDITTTTPVLHEVLVWVQSDPLDLDASFGEFVPVGG